MSGEAENTVEYDDNEPTCSACGVAWRDHMGTTGTCAELQQTYREVIRLNNELSAARACIAELEAKYRRLETVLKGVEEALQDEAEHSAELEAKNNGIEEELENCDRIISRQGKILTGVANVLKGQPPELVPWSHHDLVSDAKQLVSDLHRLQTAAGLTAENLEEMKEAKP